MSQGNQEGYPKRREIRMSIGQVIISEQPSIDQVRTTLDSLPLCDVNVTETPEQPDFSGIIRRPYTGANMEDLCDDD